MPRIVPFDQARARRMRAQDCTWDEIAEAMGVSIPTARRRTLEDAPAPRGNHSTEPRPVPMPELMPPPDTRTWFQKAMGDPIPGDPRRSRT